MSDGRRPKLVVLLPFEAVPDPASWCEGRPLSSWAAAVERAGFDGVAVTDHPFPSNQWLPTGHHAFDPFVVLTAFACATERLRLITDVLVAGYRNPYLLAKAVASLDVISGGRLTVGLAAGYQQSEFEALGASYRDRGRRFDAAIPAIVAALSGNAVSQAAEPFPAAGNTMLPPPVQRPHPPLWVGGNSDAALRRAVTLADGWMPFPQPKARVAISGSQALGSLDALAARIKEALALRTETDRGPMEFASGLFERVADPDLASRLEDYVAAGVTWVRLQVAGPTMSRSVGRLHDLAAALGH